MKPNFTYTPPSDHEAEACALACIMEDKRGRLWLDQFDYGDWDDLRHRAIYRALDDLNQMGHYLDPWRVYQRLKDTQKINGSDGLRDYVLNLPTRIPSPEQFPVYLATVKDRAWRRQALELLRALALNVCDTSQPVVDTKRKLEAAIKEFTK